MSSWELRWEAHHCQPSWLGMSCPLWLCAFLCSAGSHNSYDSSGSSCCLPAAEGDPSMCTLELIHPPWPANVSGLSLYHFCWENLGRQLPRSKSQLLTAAFLLGEKNGNGKHSGDRKGTAAWDHHGEHPVLLPVCESQCPWEGHCWVGNSPSGKTGGGYWAEDEGWGLCCSLLWAWRCSVKATRKNTLFFSPE